MINGDKCVCSSARQKGAAGSDSAGPRPSLSVDIGSTQPKWHLVRWLRRLILRSGIKSSTLLAQRFDISRLPSVKAPPHNRHLNRMSVARAPHASNSPEDTHALTVLKPRRLALAILDLFSHSHILQQPVLLRVAFLCHSAAAKSL